MVIYVYFSNVEDRATRGRDPSAMLGLRMGDTWLCCLFVAHSETKAINPGGLGAGPQVLPVLCGMAP